MILREFAPIKSESGNLVQLRNSRSVRPVLRQPSLPGSAPENTAIHRRPLSGRRTVASKSSGASRRSTSVAADEFLDRPSPVGTAMPVAQFITL